MIILGVNFSHDSSIGIIKDGKLIAAIEEEKVSRTKQDFGWPRKAIHRLFMEHKIEPRDISIVAFESEIPYALGKDEIKSSGRSISESFLSCAICNPSDLAIFIVCSNTDSLPQSMPANNSGAGMRSAIR